MPYKKQKVYAREISSEIVLFVIEESDVLGANSSMWSEIRDGFRWWMFAFSLLVIVFALLFLILMTPEDLIPHEYEVH